MEEGATRDIVRNFQMKDEWPLALIIDRMTSGRHDPVDRHASKESPFGRIAFSDRYKAEIVFIAY